jgi:hypothetical protein
MIISFLLNISLLDSDQVSGLINSQIGIILQLGIHSQIFYFTSSYLYVIK